MLPHWTTLQSCLWYRVHSVSNNESVNLLKLNELVGDNLCPTQTMVFHRVQNIVGKGETACYQHFSFAQFFKRLPVRVFQTRDYTVQGQ